MSEEEKNPEPKKIENKRERPRGGIAGKLSFLMSLAALSASGYLAYELLYKQPDLLTGGIPATARKLTADVANLKERDAGNRHDIDRLKEDQKTLTEAMRRTSQHLGKTRVDWVMAETEQLMVIANERLQLAGDLDTATTALEIADQRLRDLADPALTPVRKILAKEIHALKSAERADITGIALRLGALADSVSALPLSLEFQQVAQAEPGTEGTTTEAADQSGAVVRKEKPGFFGELWADIMSVISIRTNVESYKPLLPPQQQYFLRENLRLMILGAQQAALRGDRQTYTGNLTSAKQWASEYFDTRSQALAQLIQELEALRTAKLASARPVITGSLQALREVSRKKAGL